MIPGVVLAAGKSTRMGRPKAALPLDATDTFLSRIIRTFQQAQVEDVVVVLGHEATAVIESVERVELSPRFVLNEGYEAGQLSSLLTGLRAIDRPGVNAMLLTLVDVPLVAAATIQAVLERYRTTRAPVVRPVRGGLHGHPVLIDRSLFEEIRAADPLHGVKPIIRAHATPVGDVGVDDEGAFRDIDTPDDYRRVIELGRDVR
jgi:molybdenum cofactor cytidylyltransferase